MLFYVDSRSFLMPFGDFGSAFRDFVQAGVMQDHIHPVF